MTKRKKVLCKNTRPGYVYYIPDWATIHGFNNITIKEFPKINNIIFKAVRDDDKKANIKLVKLTRIGKKGRLTRIPIHKNSIIQNYYVYPTLEDAQDIVKKSLLKKLKEMETDIFDLSEWLVNNF